MQRVLWLTLLLAALSIDARAARRCAIPPPSIDYFDAARFVFTAEVIGYVSDSARVANRDALTRQPESGWGALVHIVNPIYLPA